MHARGNGEAARRAKRVSRVAICVSCVLLDGLQKKERLLVVYLRASVSFFPLSLPCHSFFCVCSRPNFSRQTRAETLATQATVEMSDNSSITFVSVGDLSDKQVQEKVPTKRNTS